MRTRSLSLSTLVLAAGACAGDDPPPTGIKSDAAVTCSVTIAAQPGAVTIPTSTNAATQFLVTNQCPTPGSWVLTGDRWGNIASLGTPTPSSLNLAGGGSATVSLPYMTAPYPGQAYITLRAGPNPSVEEAAGTQSVNVVTPQLPVGVFGKSSLIGNGATPASAQKWKVLYLAPNPGSIASDIDKAEADNVLLVVALPGNKGAWKNGDNFSMAKYRQQLDRFVDTSTQSNRVSAATAVKIKQAMARRRIVCYVVDEPNLPNPPISPAQVDTMAREHKLRWPDCLTIARVTPELLVSGWDTMPNTAHIKYIKLDYAWSQYNNNHAKAGLTPEQVWQAQRNIISQNGLNMGLAVSLNLWAGGLQKLNTEIPDQPCWNHLQTTATGWIWGDRPENPDSLHGVPHACDSLTNLKPPAVIASPGWIKTFTQRVANDGGFPFLLFWQHADANSASPEFTGYYTRSDFVSAFDQAVMTGQSAPAAAWRIPK
ncbi:MAG TPA: hypothetical protein VFF65_10810 [Phycisphaerales bacterium]|nr:hypothetical protein [Phycisphaerales bacterium]